MKMIDVSRKRAAAREAVVEGKICLSPSVIVAIKKKTIPKGDVLEAARLAGITAAKRTPELIPLCHPIPIEYVEIKFSLGKKEIRVTTTVKGEAKTGVEMEAFTATVLSLVTIYDMCKMHDRAASISDIKLVKKTGGKSGTWERS